MGYQQWIGEGYLGKEPVMRFTGDGKAVTNTSMAVNTSKESETRWFNLTAWERTAELLNACKKGSHVLVIGYVNKADPFEYQDGTMGANIEITVSRLRYLDKMEEGEKGKPRAKAVNDTPERNKPKPIDDVEESEDEMPF